jgi:hypothetical protein
MQAVAIASGGLKAVGQFSQGIAAMDAGKYTRKVMRINAQNSQNEGLMEREKIRFAARLAEGRQIVDQGSSGFAVGTGSAIDALRETATARELDLMTSRFNAQGRANAFKSQGDLEYAKGYSAMVGGIISGAATLMDTASSAFGGAGGGEAAAAGAGA